MNGAPVRALRVAYSPCPNDTFIYHAWSHGLLDDAPPVQVTHADIDVTNTAALDGHFDVVKVSFAALPWLLDTYRLLPCGGALGRGCGPLVLTRTEAAAGSLDGLRVAIPSDRSTAYLLMRLWAQGQQPASIESVPFTQIMPGVRDGRFDAGLVIHEARFTYGEFGLTSIVDLGAWWEQTTGLPIPLGAILARRDLATAHPLAASYRLDVDGLAETVRASLTHAWSDPSASTAYVAQHADELSPQVQAAHIALYVNEFSLDLGVEGFAAAQEFLARAATVGLVPPVGDLRA